MEIPRRQCLERSNLPLAPLHNLAARRSDFCYDANMFFGYANEVDKQSPQAKAYMKDVIFAEDTLPKWYELELLEDIPRLRT